MERRLKKLGCEQCGAPLKFEELKNGIAKCQYCGAIYTVETIKDEPKPKKIDFSIHTVYTDEPAISTIQQVQRAERKKPSGKSVLAFILSFIPYLSMAGVVLGIMDWIKTKDRPHGLSTAAIIIGGLMTLAWIAQLGK